MLNRLIFEERLLEHQPAVITGRRTTTWGELKEQVTLIAKSYQMIQKRRIGLCFPPAAVSYAALAAIERLGCDVFLVDSRLPLEEVLSLGRAFRLGAVLIPKDDGARGALDVHELDEEGSWSGSSTVTILTSGSTGRPKAARHSWESLARPVRGGSKCSTPRWLLTYRPNLYAGLQVMLQCFADRGTLVAPEPEMEPAALTRFLLDAQVQYVSATPSYWRRLLILADAKEMKRIPIVQITLGGEVADQAILDKLRHYFPTARLIHVYATTELGRCFSVSDGLAGFPSHWIGKVLPDGVELRIEEGQLLVRSQNAMRGYDLYASERADTRDWFGTGDLVQVKGDRVCFAGRISEMINVAGSKVYPIEVERAIRAVPGVSDVRVFGKSSSIAGELVACEIVADSGQDTEELKDSILRRCRAQLATYQQPRLIKFVEQLEVSSAGKILRKRTT